jgi:hypothetical protein
MGWRRRNFSSAESGKAETTKAKSINVNDLHEQLSHPDEATTRLTGRALGLNVTGLFQQCEGCLIGKAKKTRISKEPKPKDYLPGKHISIDISSPKTRSRTTSVEALKIPFLAQYCT